MRLIRSKDTKPEMLVRRLVYSMGYRYRLHSRHLPGAPDMVFTGRRKVIFVHGCMWHRHAHCRGGSRMPKSRLDYWLPKFERTRQRDADNIARLHDKGWDTLVIWECETKKPEEIRVKLRLFLDNASPVSHTHQAYTA